MKNFPYNIDSIKDCINDTESQLRDLISTILSSEYGSNWDTGEHGFSSAVIAQLNERKNQEKGNFPSQKISNRLIDYSFVLDLKVLIEDNWKDFSSIFLSKNRISFFLDELNKFRNSILHSRSDILIHQKYYLLGICGEILLSINTWHKGLRHNPNSYEVGLRFELEPSENIGVDEKIKGSSLQLSILSQRKKEPPFYQNIQTLLKYVVWGPVLCINGRFKLRPLS